MSPTRAAPVGDVLRVIAALGAEDEATRVRIGELLLGVRPGSGEQGAQAPDGGGQALTPPEPPRPPAVAPRSDGRLARGRRALQARLTALDLLRPVVGVLGLAVVAGLYLLAGVLAAAAIFVALAGALRWIMAPDAARAVPSQLIRRAAPDAPVDDVSQERDPRELLPEVDDGGEPAIDPLLVRRWEPGILFGALAIEREDRAVDVDRLVASLSRLELPDLLPRRRRRTLDRGVHVLVDVSEGMLPFAADIVEIVDRLRTVVGTGSVTVLYADGWELIEAAGEPLYAGSPFEPPPTPRAMLAITTFGLSGPRGRARGVRLEAAWLELAARMRRAGCPLVALVPHDPRLVSPALRRQFAIVPWDHTTTAAAAGRAVRR